MPVCPAARTPMNEPSKPKLEPVRCNLCGADDFQVLYDQPLRDQEPDDVGDFVASTDRYDAYGRVVRCNRCQLVYTNPRPRAEAISEGYRKAVDPDYAREDSSRSINAHLSLHTLKRFAHSGRLLDVGCATGYFLNAARLDFETQGIELSEWAAKYARDRLRLDVINAGLDEAPIPVEHFDVVALNDVIEHFTDPKAALVRIHGLLRPGGLLYLVTPDIESLSARLMRGRWWGLRPAHVYYFTPKTLTALLRDAGFEVELVKSYGRIFTWGYWLSRLKNYPTAVYRTVSAVVATLGLDGKFLYIDTRDSMEVVARRR
jgi:2-polyprenyl-3-methyl-5-hydroxy-6-metoxy-1,4-benzoquinol methylase